MKVQDLAKDSKESGYGEETIIEKFSWKVSFHEALRETAYKRGYTPGHYLRIAAEKILLELQESEKDINDTDTERRNIRMNIDRRHDVMTSIDDIHEVVRIVKDGITELDKLLKNDIMKKHARLHYESMRDYINNFENNEVKSTLKHIFNEYIDTNIRSSRTTCSLLGLNPDRDSKGHFFRCHKLTKTLDKKT